MPELYIITGSNGAGKSTVGIDYLPAQVRNNYQIFDGDKLFLSKRRELYPQHAPTHKEARKLANEWVINQFEFLVNDALSRKDIFAYEGHFSNDSTWDIPKRFKENGYTITFIFFGLDNTALSEMRVVERSKVGGHYVNPIEIDLNFYGNLKKLNQYSSLIDNLQVVDTSETRHRVLFQMVNKKITSALPYEELPDWFKNHLHAFCEMISAH